MTAVKHTRRVPPSVVAMSYSSSNQSHAFEFFAEKSRVPVDRLRVVFYVESGVWYDFACPNTGAYGQCKLSVDGTWHQPPRGTHPVVLEWLAQTTHQAPFATF